MKELSFDGMHVMVLGDIMLDRYLYGDVHRISPEAPVPVLSYTGNDSKLGGAANVALNLQAMGVEVDLVSMIGADNYGDQMQELLSKAGFNTRGILKDLTRKTTVKTRVMHGFQQLLRVDEEDISDISNEMLQRITDKITFLFKENVPDVLIFQDYNKGLLTLPLIEQVITMCKQYDVFTAVDPKKTHFFAYRGVDLFKPNLSETEQALKINIAPSEEALTSAAKSLFDVLDNRFTLISLSEHGVFITDQRQSLMAPTKPRNIVDVCGAGDAVLSISALALSKKMSLSQTALLANLAGGNVCERQGVCPLKFMQVLSEFKN